MNNFGLVVSVGDMRLILHILKDPEQGAALGMILGTILESQIAESGGTFGNTTFESPCAFLWPCGPFCGPRFDKAVSVLDCGLHNPYVEMGSKLVASTCLCLLPWNVL